MVWVDELKDCENELIIKATRKICSEEENNLKINIARIKNKYKELKEEQNKKENYEKWQEEMKIRIDPDSPALKKLNDLIEQMKK